MVVVTGASGVATRRSAEPRPEHVHEAGGQRRDQIGAGDDGGGGGERRHDHRDVAGDAQRRVARGERPVAPAGRDLDLDVAERGELRLA